MADEKKLAETAEAVKGVLQEVPVYKDAVQPAAQEFGKALKPAGTELAQSFVTVTKAVNMVLSPLAAMVWGYEKLRDVVIPALAERFRGKEEALVTPKPNVAAPILEGLRYTEFEPLLRDMYLNLLASAMDKETAYKAHPAFVEVIKQVTPDEARVMHFLASYGSFVIIWKIDFHWPPDLTKKRTLSDSLRIPRRVGCLFPELIHSYFDNLSRLGIIEVGGGSGSPTAETFRQMLDPDEVQLMKAEMKNDAAQWNNISFKSAKLSSFGAQFCNACVAATK